MTKIINLGTSAFYELQEATKKAKKTTPYVYTKTNFKRIKK